MNDRIRTITYHIENDDEFGRFYVHERETSVSGDESKSYCIAGFPSRRQAVLFVQDLLTHPVA
jgi:hypothetical protein